MSTIERSEGQRAFGADPEGYHGARPSYPEKVFDILRERCGLQPGCRTVEIGAGTGISTRRLLELGADPLVVVEADERLAVFLRQTLPTVDVRVTTFEEASLPMECFDLGACASAFHWLDETASLRKVGEILRDGGWWAAWWNLFFDTDRTDEFHKATQVLMETLAYSPSRGENGRPSFAMDREMRLANLRAAGIFENIEFESLRWSVVLDSARVVRLYGTFSPIGRLEAEKRNRLLDAVGRIAETQFAGKVELCITTPIYTARRQPRNETRGRK